MNIKKAASMLVGLLPDKPYIQIKFRHHMGHRLNLKNPVTYNEKLQWLKLYNRDPLYTQLVDKYAVRDYIAQKIGSEYLIPLVGGPWNTFEEIDFDSLPQSFVLKCTHDSGSVVVCRDKSEFNKETSCEFLKWRMKKNYYKVHREWPYKNVKPRLMAEKYMVDESGVELKDYKWLCFNGKAAALFIARDRFADSTTTFDFFDTNFNHLDFTYDYPNSSKPFVKPAAFDEMREIAEKLSVGMPHVRVDLYEINGKVFFGELTFYTMSGFTPFNPSVWDKKFGDLITLPTEKKYGY